VQVGDRVAGIFFKHGLQAHRKKIKSALGCDRWNAGRVRRVASGWSGSPAGSSSYEEGATLPVRQSQLARIGASRRADRNRALLLGTGEFRSAAFAKLLGAKAIITQQ